MSRLQTSTGTSSRLQQNHPENQDNQERRTFAGASWFSDAHAGLGAGYRVSLLVHTVAVGGQTLHLVIGAVRFTPGQVPAANGRLERVEIPLHART